MNKVASRHLGFWISLSAIMASIGCHVYLAWLHYQTKNGLGFSDGVCNLSATFNCHTAIESKYSEFLGVPLGLWGFVFNTFLLIALIQKIKSISFLDRPPEQNQRNIPQDGWSRLYALGTFFSVGVSLVMASISFFSLKSLCPFCLATYLLSFMNLIGFLIQKKQSSMAPRMNTPTPLKPIALAATAVLLSGLVLGSVLKKSFEPDAASKFAKIAVDEWSSNPEQGGDVAYTLAIGAAADQAKMKIVEFADLLCGHCKETSGPLKEFIQTHPLARLELQIYSLDGECNSKIQQKVGIRCQLSRLTYCAQKIDAKGIDVVKWIFDKQEQFYDVTNADKLIQNLIAELSLKEAEIKTCVASEEAKNMASAQSELGNKWGVEGTPTIFVNKKKLNGGRDPILLDHVYRTLTK